MTVAADKAYDTKDLVAVMRELNVTPPRHRTKNGRAAARLTEPRDTPDNEVSFQRKRKRIEEVFGWMKTVGMLRKNAPPGKSSRSDGFLPAGRRL